MTGVKTLTDYLENGVEGKRFQERIKRRGRFGNFERFSYEVIDVYSGKNGLVMKVEHDSLGTTYLPVEQHYQDWEVRTFYLPSAK